MKNADLIRLLQAFDPGMEVMILDGANGGGAPRSLNLGPCVQTIVTADETWVADCEGRVGEHVIVLGFGCY
jgi:hypothetical protein